MDLIVVMNDASGQSPKVQAVDINAPVIKAASADVIVSAHKDDLAQLERRLEAAGMCHIDTTKPQELECFIIKEAVPPEPDEHETMHCDLSTL